MSVGSDEDQKLPRRLLPRVNGIKAIQRRKCGRIFVCSVLALVCANLWCFGNELFVPMVCDRELHGLLVIITNAPFTSHQTLCRAPARKTRRGHRLSKPLPALPNIWLFSSSPISASMLTLANPFPTACRTWRHAEHYAEWKGMKCACMVGVMLIIKQRTNLCGRKVDFPQSHRPCGVCVWNCCSGYGVEMFWIQ